MITNTGKHEVRIQFPEGMSLADVRGIVARRFSEIGVEVIADHPELQNVVVTNMGRVRRTLVSAGTSEKTYLTPKGYEHFAHTEASGEPQRKYTVHRAVLRTFTQNPEDKPAVDHINHSRADNRLFNLRWATHAENTDNRSEAGWEAIRKGREASLKWWEARRGTNNHNAKLSEDDIREIRVRYAAGGVTHRVLADEYGVARSVISKIIIRRTWQHI